MPLIALLNANALNEEQIADICGIGVRQVYRLRDQGVLRKGRRGFKLAECVQAFVRHREAVIRQACSKTDGVYERARSRRMAAQAAVEELRAGELRGELLRADDVDREVCAALSIVRSHLMALPSRCARALLADVPEKDARFALVYNKLNVEVRRSLSEASELEAGGVSRRNRAKRNGADADSDA